MLADAISSDQQAAFVKSILEDWEHAHDDYEPSLRTKWGIPIPNLFGKRQSRRDEFLAESTRILCLALTAAGLDTESEVQRLICSCKVGCLELTHGTLHTLQAMKPPSILQP